MKTTIKTLKYAVKITIRTLKYIVKFLKRYNVKIDLMRFKNGDCCNEFIWLVLALVQDIIDVKVDDAVRVTILQQKPFKILDSESQQ